MGCDRTESIQRKNSTQMAQEFLPNPNDEANAPASSETSDMAPGDCLLLAETLREGHQRADRVKLKHILIGSPKVVRSTIHLLHVLGYAEATAWSPLQPTANPGETMSILVRYLLRE